MHLKTYASLGIVPHSHNGPEAIAGCFFCGSDKFYINSEEGLYSCKVCGESGNKYTFIKKVYEECLKDTTDLQYQDLAEARGLPPAVFGWHRVAYYPGCKKWLIPVWESGKLINLRTWNEDTNLTLSLGGCRSGLYNGDKLERGQEFFLCEGEWDCMAMDWMLSIANNTDTGVCSVPGASTFKTEWIDKFKGKDVILAFDNDKAGREGSDRAAKLLYGKAKTLRTVSWKEGTPDKYDIRDHLKEGKTLSDLNIVPYEPPKVLPLFQKKVGFYDVVKEFKKEIFLTDDMVNGLLLEMAVVFSNKLAGDPLWLFIIGPPGAGKSLLLNAVSGTNRTIFQSNLGPKTLVSGFKTNDGTDPSLLPKLIGNTLILKEYTEIMALSGNEQEQIFATLRGAYDGRVERDYAHGVTRIYPDPNGPHKSCHFSMLAGVTNAIHGDNRAALGERFLKYQMFPDDYDPVSQIKSAINVAMEQASSPEQSLKEIASSFIQEKLDRKMILPKTPAWVQERIIGLSQIVSVIRANVSRRQGDLVYRPAPEVGTRLSKQLVKIGQCVAYALDKKEVDDQVYKLILRVGLDTCYGWHRDVIMSISETPGIILKTIQRNAVIGKGTAEKCLEDLYELRAIDYKERKGQQGHPPKEWNLTPSMKELYKMAGLESKANYEEVLTEIPKDTRYRRKTFARKFIAKG